MGLKTPPSLISKVVSDTTSPPGVGQNRRLFGGRVKNLSIVSSVFSCSDISLVGESILRTNCGAAAFHIHYNINKPGLSWARLCSCWDWALLRLNLGFKIWF